MNFTGVAVGLYSRNWLICCATVWDGAVGTEAKAKVRERITLRPLALAGICAGNYGIVGKAAQRVNNYIGRVADPHPVHVVESVKPC